MKVSVEIGAAYPFCLFFFGDATMFYSTRFSMCIVGVAIGILTFVPAAKAIKIESSQHGVVFEDDFELSTVGEFPDNGALPGVWDGNPPPRVVVVDDATPGAFQGANYLKLDRTSPSSPETQANSFSQFTDTPVTTGTLHTEVMLNIPLGNENYVEIVVSTNPDYSDFPTAWVSNILAYPGVAGPNGGNGVHYYDPAQLGNFPTGINFTHEVWQKWELDHDIAAGTYTITVDGISSDPLPFIDPISGGEGISMFSFRSGFINTRFYMDAVSAATPPTVPGDFDFDGDVDGADFVIWQTNFPKAEGGTLDTGDADGDGDVDGADFVVWQTNFPFTPGPRVSAVPEPQSLALLAVGTVLMAVALRCRRNNK